MLEPCIGNGLAAADNKLTSDPQHHLLARTTTTAMKHAWLQVASCKQGEPLLRGPYLSIL